METVSDKVRDAAVEAVDKAFEATDLRLLFHAVRRQLTRRMTIEFDRDVDGLPEPLKMIIDKLHACELGSVQLGWYRDDCK